MAAPSTPEASEIRRRGRRRLLGAITLVLLVVAIVPMILDSEPRPQRAEPSLTIPSKEIVSPLPMPAPATPQAASAPPAQAANAPTADPAKAAKVEVAAARTAPPEAPKAAPATPKLEGFAVQVGAFRDEQRLQEARGKLEAAGIVHYTERIDAGGGTMTRLRAGPFPTREGAEKARAKLQDGQVVALP
jgi:DedD protein